MKIKTVVSIRIQILIIVASFGHMKSIEEITIFSSIEILIEIHLLICIVTQVFK